MKCFQRNTVTLLREQCDKATKWSGKICLVACCVGMGIARIAASQVAVERPPTFDVVSIKPSTGAAGMRSKTTPVGVQFTSTTLWQLIFTAYNIKIRDQVKGLPAWGETTGFDITAKTDDATSATLAKLPPSDQLNQHRLMLQAMLMDRFKLQIHREEQDRPIYILTIAKRGIKLQPSQIPDAAAAMRESGGKIEAKGMKLSALASVLSDELGRIVVDKTGLPGKYDVTLHWSPELQKASSADGGSTLQDAGPSIFTALEDELGLKLEPSKGPVDTIIIDHVEKPTVN